MMWTYRIHPAQSQRGSRPALADDEPPRERQRGTGEGGEEYERKQRAPGMAAGNSLNQDNCTQALQPSSGTCPSCWRADGGDAEETGPDVAGCHGNSADEGLTVITSW